MRAFAEALEVIPYTLAENAGLNPIEIVTELRNHHAQGRRHHGESPSGSGWLLRVHEVVIELRDHHAQERQHHCQCVGLVGWGSVAAGRAWEPAAWPKQHTVAWAGNACASLAAHPSLPAPLPPSLPPSPGINVRKGATSDMLEESVVQPLLVTTSALSLATEAARLILKIDDIGGLLLLAYCVGLYVCMRVGWVGALKLCSRSGCLGGWVEGMAAWLLILS